MSVVFVNAKGYRNTPWAVVHKRSVVARFHRERWAYEFVEQHADDRVVRLLERSA